MAANLCIACVPPRAFGKPRASTVPTVNAINPKRTKKAKAKVPITEPILCKNVVK